MGKPSGLVWRSLLFVPADAERYIQKAPTAGADGIILDLEDGVAAENKKRARKGLPAVIAKLSSGRSDLLVRINAPMRLAVRDLEAAVRPQVRAIVVPKVENAEQVRQVASIIDELERERALENNSVKLIALIESAKAIAQMQEIASSSSRMTAMLLGSEDFSASIGARPDTDTLLLPNQLLIYAARAAGITPMGFVGSIADFSNLEEFRGIVKHARAMGFVGGFCIHPDQVAVMNQEYAPTQTELEEARAITAAFEQSRAQGEAVTRYRGRMIDLPVALRAREMIQLYQQIAARETYGDEELKG